MKNKRIFGAVLTLIIVGGIIVGATNGETRSVKAASAVKKAVQNFLTLSIGQGDISNIASTYLIISGGSFTAGHAYCSMVTPPAGDETIDEFIISVDGTKIGTCILTSTATFGFTTLTSTDLSPGTVVRVEARSDVGARSAGAVTIAP